MTKKTRIRIWIIVVIMCVMCFSDWSFAEDGLNSAIWTVAWTLDFVISVLSRIWVIFAKLAWEFLTNNWVFWEKMWIDILLWQYWTIVRNIANFCLWFYFVYVVFKGLVWQIGDKEDIIKNLKNVLLRILVAWVWIQASWFLTSLFIDLSTITLAAVGSFPSQIISENETVNEGIKVSMWDYFGNGGAGIAKGKVYTLFTKTASANSFTKIEWKPLDRDLDEEDFIDSLLPNKDDVSGPLYYLWFQILKVSQINSFGSWEKNSLKKTILNLIIQWWTTVVYSIEMGVLCVIALMRILYLWMFIVLSPFAILLTCIQKAWEKDLVKKWFVADLLKQINLKTFLAKVFQPEIIVLWISLSMIFVTLISRVVNRDSMWSMNDFNVWWVSITTNKDNTSSANEDETYTTRLKWDLLEFSVSHLWKWILDFMLSIITVILVYWIINMSIKIWNKIWDWQDFLSKSIDKVQKWVNGVIGSVPLVPVAWYDKDWVPKTRFISAGQVFGLWGKNSLIEEKIYRTQRSLADKYTEQNEVIDKWFKDENDVTFKTLKSWNKTLIEQEVEAKGAKWLNILGVQIEKMREIRDFSRDNKLEKGEWYGMVLNPSADDKWWWWRFKDWLENVDVNDISWEDYSVWRDMVGRWRNGENKNKLTFDNLFEDSRFVKAYAKEFGLWAGIDTWDKLKNKDISEKKQ